MINAIQEMADLMVKAAAEQSSQIAAELSAAFDSMNEAKVRFNEAMKRAQAKRAEADEIERKAWQEFDTATSQDGAVKLSIVQQLNEGRMVTGSALPTTKKLAAE